MPTSEAAFLEIWVSIERQIARVARSVFVAAVAVFLSTAQNYADYSEWSIGALVFVLGSLQRFSWLAGVLVLWLLALYLAPPEMVAAFKAIRG